MLTECHCDGQVEKLLRAVADGDVEMVRVKFFFVFSLFYFIYFLRDNNYRKWKK